MSCQCFSRGFPSKFPCRPCASEELCESKMCFAYILWGEMWGPRLLSHLIAAARGERVAEPWPGVPAPAVPAGKPWQHRTFFPFFLFQAFPVWTVNKECFSKCLYSAYLTGLCFPLGLLGAFVVIMKLKLPTGPTSSCQSASPRARAGTLHCRAVHEEEKWLSLLQPVFVTPGGLQSFTPEH